MTRTKALFFPLLAGMFLPAVTVCAQTALPPLPWLKANPPAITQPAAPPAIAASPPASAAAPAAPVAEAPAKTAPSAPPAEAAENTAPPPPVMASPAPAPEKPDEFAAALASAYSTNPQLKAQRAAQKALDEGVAQAISGFRPTATAGYNIGRQRYDTNDAGQIYKEARERSVDVTQPIFNGGTTLADYVSAKDRVKAGFAQLTALEQQVLLNAVDAYTDLVQKESVLQVNQNNVDVLTKQLQATQSRFDVGELTETDVAQSQARLASAQASERQALGDVESSRATFRRVIGFDPPLSVLDLPPVPSDLLPQNVEEAQSLAQTNEPTLQAARRLAKAAQSDVRARAGVLLPSVNVEETSTRNNGTSPFARSVNNDSLMLNVSVPLYQSGSEWSAVRAAKDQAEQAKFNAFDTRDSVQENVTRAWQDYNTAKAVIVSNEQAVKAAQDALDNIRQEALYGTRTILDVLNTEQDLFTAELQLVTARVTEKQQAYRLLSAVGKLTARDLHLAVDLVDPKQHYEDVKYKLIGF